MGTRCAFPQRTDDFAMALRKCGARFMQFFVDRADLRLIFENDENFDALAAAFPNDLAFQSGAELPGLSDGNQTAEECGGE